MVVTSRKGKINDYSKKEKKWELTHLSILSEDGEVEVVVVVCDSDLSGEVDAHTDGIVRDAWKHVRRNLDINGSNSHPHVTRRETRFIF